MPYAEKTEVPIERSIAEIIGMLRKAGAERIAQMEEPGRFTVSFELAERLIRFRVELPSIGSMPMTYEGGRAIPPERRREMAAQSARQRGRALMLVVKAKLESVESRVETFEQAFLANVVLPGGATLYEQVQERIAIAYQSGEVGPLLLEGPRS